MTQQLKEQRINDYYVMTTRHKYWDKDYVPRCVDVIEVLDESGQLVDQFGPMRNYREMADFDVSELHSFCGVGLYIRAHLNFHEPLVEACEKHLQLLQAEKEKNKPDMTGDLDEMLKDFTSTGYGVGFDGTRAYPSVGAYRMDWDD